MFRLSAQCAFVPLIIFSAHLIPDATHTHPVCTVVAVHVGIATVEVQVSGIGATNRGTPHVAVAAHIVERAIVVAVATNGPLLVTTLIIARPGIHAGPMQANIAGSYLIPKQGSRGVYTTGGLPDLQGAHPQGLLYLLANTYGSGAALQINTMQI